MSMKRYVIEARRDASEKWTAWGETDDISKITYFTDMAQKAGFEFRVMDYKIEFYESKHSTGNLLICPVRIGETVYEVVKEEDKYVLRGWVVRELIYNGKTWRAVGDGDRCEEVGSLSCTNKKHAQMVAKRMTEDLAWQS